MQCSSAVQEELTPHSGRSMSAAFTPSQAKNNAGTTRRNSQLRCFSPKQIKNYSQFTILLKYS